MKSTKQNRVFRETNSIGSKAKPKFQIYSEATITCSNVDYNLERARLVKVHVNKLIKGLIEVVVRYDRNGKKYAVPTKIWVSKITQEIKNRI